MYIGAPNPNIMAPLEKMTIEPKGKSSFEVLYNPESYVQSRSVRYAQSSGISTNTPVSQFAGGSLEVLQFRLFFDSMSAGSEVGGGLTDRLKFTANSLLPSITKIVDVRKYTKKVYKLMEIDPDKHVPPLLKLKWASLQFTGHLISCQQNFVRFNEQGIPLRAWLDCVFQEFIPPQKATLPRPLESPDTTKYRTVHQGDALWSLSAREYGQPEQWRAIADANGLANPRTLRSGDRLVLPAIKKG
ncbi:CIS tube protein [Flavonifractor sp. An82]|uniref:CIS tube protein n=1 Tax=Flavonifractor sp. An82 TaxID=1965660 RepID=UPI000B37443D|nr:LysM peptidoglycan-binding domain-containing protein [Flavonifractor sp. An82]OUN22062.1 hypothetical protein B5G34_08490 [Flavonifractor sp. An82]